MLVKRLLGRSPLFWPTVITVPAVLVILALGGWQIQRLFWKLDLIDRIETRAVGEAVAPPDFDRPIEDIRYQRVRLDGVFDHSAEMLLVGRPEKGTVGYHVVTPLVADDGRTFLVNRGWIPEDRKAPETRAGSRPEGPVTVEGLVERDRRTSYFTPANEPERGLWFYADTAEMAAFHDLERVAPYLVMALAGDEADAPRLPIAADLDGVMAVRNEHLQYAVTWFALAVALIAIYVIYHRRNAEGPEA